MKLENFVNAMGVNVIQVIDQIQSDQNGQSKTSYVVDADKFINKDWFKERWQNDIIKEVEDNIDMFKDYLTPHSLCSSSSTTRDSGMTGQKSVFRMIRESNTKKQQVNNKNKDEKPNTKNEDRSNDNTDMTKPSLQHEHLESKGKKDLMRITAKPLGITGLPFYRSLLTPVRCPVAGSSIIKVVKNKSDKKRDSLQAIRSRVWRRPKQIKWCSAKDFLSKRIKTYEAACELVARSGVIVRTMKNNKNKTVGDEYFDVCSSVDRIFYVSLPLMCRIK